MGIFLYLCYNERKKLSNVPRGTLKPTVMKKLILFVFLVFAFISHPFPTVLGFLGHHLLK